jgi:cytochrome P450
VSEGARGVRCRAVQPAAVALMDSVSRVARPRSRVRTDLPAGPAIPSAAQLALWVVRPYPFLEHCRARYGSTFSLRFPQWPTLVSFSDEASIKDLFTGPPDQLYAGGANASLRPIVGKGSLLLLDGEKHLRERRLLLPPFHGARMQAYGATIQSITRRTLQAMTPGVRRIQQDTQSITLDVILRTVFGVDEGADLAALRTAIGELVDRASMLDIIPALQIDLGARSPWGGFVRRRAEVDRLLYRLIDARRTEGTAGRDDVLTLLLEARYEDGSGMTNRDLRDELMTLLAAGHETSATALAWTLTALARAPDVQRLAHEEVDRVLSGAADDAVTKAELPYVEGAVKESMRLHPVVSAVGRVLQVPMTIGGIDLPAGTLAGASIYLTHRDPALWPDPLRFDPARFVGTRPSPYAYLPFGGGVRRCIGMAFALYEMRIVLAEILRAFRIEPAPGTTARPVRRTVTMAPEGGAPIRLVRR